MRELGRQMAGDTLRQARAEIDEEHEFELGGRRWYAPAGVVGSQYNASTELFARWLPTDGITTMLEMGCGCGVAAVTAALAGCPDVLAVDVNPQAVVATTENARRFGVADRVSALHSDLFGAVDPTARFDLVYWNSPFVDGSGSGDGEGPGDGDHLADHFFDPGYELHERFVSELPRRLSERGRAVIGFSCALGDLPALTALSAARGLEVRTLRSESFAVPHTKLGAAAVYRDAADGAGNVTVDFTLLELVRDDGRSTAG